MFFQNLISFLLASALHFGGTNANETFNDASLLSVMSIPVQKEDAQILSNISAESALAIDINSNAIFFEKNDTERRKIASLTKLMTAYIILNENDPNSVVSVSQNAAGIGGSRMGLMEGEQITIKDLLYGLLIESGNDAATALAEFNAGSESAFVEKMNTTAKKLGLENTSYANTMGLDAENAYSTVHDLSVLAVHLLKDQTIRDIIKISSIEITSLSGQTHKLVNTNILLGESGIKGFKTGSTTEAGECLIGLADTSNGKEVLTIVLGSKSRFIDTKVLVEWINNNFVW